MQTITALPSVNTSPLTSVGRADINYNVNNVQAVSVAVLRVGVSAGVGTISGPIAVGITIFDMIGAGVSGFTPHVRVTSGATPPRYDWDVNVIANFHFVSRTNNPHQSHLVAVVTNARGWVRYTGSYEWINANTGLRQSRTVNEPEYFGLANSFFLGWPDALNVLYGRRAPIHSFVGNIPVSRGTNGNQRHITTIFLLRPTGLAHVM